MYKSATYETLHWKIIASFQYAFAKELLGESSNESTLDSINHYLAFGEQTYYDDIILYRQRLLKKHKAN
ncbi:hypothetical protein [Alkalibacterium sp. MB6]|uniref:hypothetical protein n=1 Tax=Alkalibacterium sp. MB6 TaxID=2081965 RepID=UPI00137A3D5F|nr:hypothetical protein [Alkalibacterium sp. MB6]